MPKLRGCVGCCAAARSDIAGTKATASTVRARVFALPGLALEWRSGVIRLHTERYTKRMDVLYGLHPVEEALRAGLRRFDHVCVAKERHDARLQQVIDLCRAAGVRLRFEPREQLTRLAQTLWPSGSGCGRSREVGSGAGRFVGGDSWWSVATSFSARWGGRSAKSGRTAADCGWRWR